MLKSLKGEQLFELLQNIKAQREQSSSKIKSFCDTYELENYKAKDECKDEEEEEKSSKLKHYNPPSEETKQLASNAMCKLIETIRTALQDVSSIMAIKNQ